MNGSGCKNCPVSPCHTLYYRGSYCREQRAKHGLGDPMTNADRIRSMSDEELAWELMTWRLEAVAKYHGVESQYPDTQKTILSWLQQPAETPKEDS